MIEFIRLLLLLAIAAAAMTFVGSAIAWWMDEPRRLRRIVRRVLGGAPDGMITAQGRGCAAGFSLAAGQVLVMRDGGADALLYPLRALHGAELIVDDMVAARVMRDEPRRVLDQINAAAGRVTLRLLFDDPRHPDFSLELWAPEDAHRREARTAAATIREARGWLGRAEAILRRTAPPAAAPTPVSAPPMVPEHEAGGPMPPLAPSHPPERPPSSERPPWEDEPDEDRIEDNEFEPDDDAANALRPEDHNPPRLL